MPAPEALSSAVAGAQEIRADVSWQVVDFISDLHLQAKDPATFAAWQHYMRQTPVDALFILGDLFEVWVGDDLITAAHDPQAQFVAQCQLVLQEATRRMAVFFMHGNRDFLLGHSCAGHCKLQLLNDPSVLVFDSQRWLVSHGDALCLDDTEYQQFRQQVRSPRWQAEFWPSHWSSASKLPAACVTTAMRENIRALTTPMWMRKPPASGCAVCAPTH